MCPAAGNPGLGSAFAQASAQAFAGAASSGGSGASASASAFALAIGQGGASAQAAALALAQSFCYGYQAAAFAQAIAIVIQQKGCAYVKPTLVEVSTRTPMLRGMKNQRPLAVHAGQDYDQHNSQWNHNDLTESFCY